jgi:hypothetical protein
MSESNNAWPAYARVPPFLPVPVRARADGWTEDRQARFIGLLAETGSVAAAARAVGLSETSAYRLRKRAGAGSFAHAWDAVVEIRRGERPAKRKVSAPELADYAFEGPLVVMMRRRRFVRAVRKPSVSALLRHLAWCDRAAAGIEW